MLFLTSSWNPQLIFQAEDRIVRSGNIGKRKIFHFYFGTTVDAHLHIIRNKKSLWETFCLSPGTDLFEGFKVFLDVLKYENAHQKLLDTHNPDYISNLLKKDNKIDEGLLDYIKENIQNLYKKTYPQLLENEANIQEDLLITTHKRKIKDGIFSSSESEDDGDEKEKQLDKGKEKEQDSSRPFKRLKKWQAQ